MQLREGWRQMAAVQLHRAAGVEGQGTAEGVTKQWRLSQDLVLCRPPAKQCLDDTQ